MGYSFFFSYQHIAHLEALLKKNQSVSTRNLHDSSVRTLCICEQQQVNLDKVRTFLPKSYYMNDTDLKKYGCTNECFFFTASQTSHFNLFQLFIYLLVGLNGLI